MSTQKQPEALRLAGILQGIDAGNCFENKILSAAEGELRRQHARIAELEAQLDAVGAGGVSALMRPAQCMHQVAEPADWASTLQHPALQKIEAQASASPKPSGSSAPHSSSLPRCARRCAPATGRQTMPLKCCPG